MELLVLSFVVSSTSGQAFKRSQCAETQRTLINAEELRLDHRLSIVASFTDYIKNFALVPYYRVFSFADCFDVHEIGPYS